MSHYNTNAPITQNEFKMKTGQCCNDPGLCCFATCCHCFALKEIADNIGNPRGWVHCLAAYPFALGCCSLTMLGEEVAKKRSIPMTTAESACQSFFAGCTCYSCKVLHESRVYKKGVVAVRDNQVMEDRVGASTEMV